MNELELRKLWQASNDKLDDSLVMIKNNTDINNRIKVHGFLSSMKPIKIFTLLIGILWVGIGVFILSGIYLNAFLVANKFFLFSATIQILLTAIALFIYVYQLIKIYQVDVSDPILLTQNKLAKLKISTLWITRILFLQLPVWTTFWWNDKMLTDWNFFQWSIVLLFTVSFSFFALWLFFNIKFENRNKKWFKLIFIGKEWSPIIKSMELLEQVNEYRTDTANTYS